MFLILTLLILVLLLCLYYLSTYKFDYWKKKNVPFEKPVPVFGNYREFITLKECIGDVVERMCHKYKKLPYFGAFYGTEPTLVILDPELVKLVMTKDFYYFSGREVTKYTNRETITQNLFFSGGNQWKIFRQNMTPLFSSAKMKNMFYLIEKCSYIFEDMLDSEVDKCDVLEIRSIIIRFAMECIGSCVFGVDTYTMKSTTENNLFFVTGTKIFENSDFRGIKNVVRAIWPALFYGVGLKVFPQGISTFFNNLLTNVFQSRDYKPSSRKDFVDLILNLKKDKYLVGDSFDNIKTGGNKKIEVEVTDEVLIAQCVALFAGGFETTATATSFTLFELAKNPEAQQKAFEEVAAYFKSTSNKLTYECVSELPYLNACIEEALRLYPVIGVTTREVVDDYTFPTGLKLEKGLRVHVPVHYFHRNPEYFPEPDKYKPERFLAENQQNIVPHTYMAFGEGGRYCIGKRFAKMQVLAGLATFLKKYRVELAEGMPTELKMEPRAIVTQSDGPIMLKCCSREGWEQRVLKRDH